MTLIDHYNWFQGLSRRENLSANARSLYFAILGEFNEARYPAELKLSNEYLQHLSGIKSSASFDSARNALLNAGAIKSKKRVYKLTGNNLGNGTNRFFLNPFEEKSFERKTEIGRKSVENSLGLLNIKKNKDGEREEKETAPPPPTAAGAREPVFEGDEPEKNLRAGVKVAPKSTNSAAVVEMWRKWNGVPYSGGVALTLIEFENSYGTEKLLKAIEAAGRYDKKGALTLPLLEKVLSNVGQKVKKVADNYGGDDELPE